MSTPRVLVLGAGGREHALAWALSRSPQGPDVWVAPGNAGIAREFACHALEAQDGDAVVAFCREHGVDLVVVGPEAPLVAGVVDALDQAGIPAFGPSREAARLEGSKIFSKEIMDEAGVPTAAYRSFTDPAEARAFLEEQGERRWVLKADGLAAGKGVLMCSTLEQAVEGIDALMVEARFGSAGSAIVAEEWMEGPELSLFVVCDGSSYRCFPALRDHKRLADGDHGPNTGGMGAFQPLPDWDDDRLALCERLVVEPMLETMKRRGSPYRGLLYCGLMWTADGPRVLEFNVRFGDPETQPLMAALDCDFYAVVDAAARGELGDVPMTLRGGATLCVVLAGHGYPESGRRGQVIEGLDEAAGIDEVKVFHAGTSAGENGSLLATGGRVLGVTAWGEDLAQARERAYAAVACIRWEGMQHRNDIGASALGEKA